jgi:hypothetical protein
MFGFFDDNKNICPVQEKTRKWIDLVFLWFFKTFGKEKIIEKKIMIPHYNDFPIKYNGSEENALETLRIVASQMDIDSNDITLSFYTEGMIEISSGGVFGSRYFMKSYEDEKGSAGKYIGKGEDGKYHLLLEDKKLKEPENMVATLAHEIAHIKLLGEGRIKENNERLTDLTTVIFGLGIFNANSAFQFSKDFSSWSTSKQGYLTQMEWGYALALLSYLKKENNPEWTKYLTKNIRSDFNKSISFIMENEDIVLNYEYASKKE